MMKQRRSSVWMIGVVAVDRLVNDEKDSMKDSNAV
jgi:hypothetical protein